MLVPCHALRVASSFHRPVRAKLLSGGSGIKGERAKCDLNLSSAPLPEARGFPQPQIPGGWVLRRFGTRIFSSFYEFVRRFRVLRISFLVCRLPCPQPVPCWSLSCHSVLRFSFCFFTHISQGLFWCEPSHPSQLCTGQVMEKATAAEL